MIDYDKLYFVSENISPDFENAEAFLLLNFKELSPLLTYHSFQHTMDVLNAAMSIASAEKISENEKRLLRISVLLHDAGFIYVYKDHEEKGCEMAKESLPRFGFTTSQIAEICGMIMATKTPQHPKTKLEQIIADSDLDYLGRDDVNDIAAKLFDELIAYGYINNEKDWNKLQVDFLQNHHYHTNYSKTNRQPKKERYLAELLKKILAN